jgi:ribosomal RNA assembly protein
MSLGIDSNLNSLKETPKRKKTSKKEEKEEYNPLPPEQKPRKIDLELESGDYFMTDNKKDRKKNKDKQKNPNFRNNFEEKRNRNNLYQNNIENQEEDVVDKKH